jgi:hypothetical protein
MSTGTLSAALGYLTVVWMGDLIPGFGWLIGRHQPQGD